MRNCPDPAYHLPCRPTPSSAAPGASAPAGPAAGGHRRRRPRRPSPRAGRGPRRPGRPRTRPPSAAGHPPSPGPGRRKKGAPSRRRPDCHTFAGHKATAGRNLLTAAGDVRLQRLYLVCPRCGTRRYPLDDRLGLQGFVSPQARKLLTLAGASWSFAGAAGHRAAFGGLRTCDPTIRAVCYEEAGRLADWLPTDPAAGRALAAARGDVAFPTDGPLVNTWEGGRELRRGVFAKRQRGRPATAAWDTRRWPAPHARVLFGGLETAAHFGPRLRRWASRLGITDAAAVSVLGDGAEWLGHQAAAGCRGLRDVYHGCAHRAGCAQALYAAGTEARAWVDQGRQALLTEGAAGVQAHLAAARATARSAARREALDGVARYFARRADYLGYAERLAGGQSIGSGLGEGACQQVLGRRMKQTGARWRVRRANRMATLCCTFYGDTWKPYWRHRLN